VCLGGIDGELVDFVTAATAAVRDGDAWAAFMCALPPPPASLADMAPGAAGAPAAVGVLGEASGNVAHGGKGKRGRAQAQAQQAAAGDDAGAAAAAGAAPSPPVLLQQMCRLATRLTAVGATSAWAHATGGVAAAFVARACAATPRPLMRAGGGGEAAAAALSAALRPFVGSLGGVYARTRMGEVCGRVLRVACGARANYVFVCVNICVCACACACACVLPYMYVFVCQSLCVFVCVCVRVRFCARLHPCANARVPVVCWLVRQLFVCFFVAIVVLTCAHHHHHTSRSVYSCTRRRW
jgi:hypothetical protein